MNGSVLQNSITYTIVHKTRYRYTAPVKLCYNEARLTPRNSVHQACREHQFVVDPLPRTCRDRSDFFGNTVHAFAIQQPHTELSVTATSRVEVHSREPQQGAADYVPWELVRSRLQTGTDPEILEVRQYMLDSPMIPRLPELQAYAAESFTPDRPLLETVKALSTRLYTDFVYDPYFTDIATPLADVIQHRRGVCQDFAHLGIGCLRALGLAARYVSGYIETEPPDQSPLVGADASHAWFSVYFPQLGWVDVDPTNNQMPTNRHITVAWGRDYADVTPLKGVVFGIGTHELSVSVTCERETAW